MARDSVPNIDRTAGPVLIDDLTANPLFWIARDAMVIYDVESGSVVQLNPAAEQLLGYAADEVRGVALASLIPECSREETVARLTKSIVEAGSDGDSGTPLEVDVVHKSGRHMIVEFTATPFVSPASSCFMIIFRDCTERKRLESERASLLAKAQEHSRRVSELASLKADFTAMIAHELGNPVAAIGAMSELLERESLPDEHRRNIRKSLRAEAGMLQRLVDDMRAATAFEHEEFTVRPRQVLLESLIAYSIASTQLRGHEDALEVGQMPVVTVLADPERITQVLQNLLGNAFKHTPPGTRVQLRARQLDGQVRVEVSDNGPGIHPDDLSRIFTKFGRGRDTSGNRVSGVGLGLYLSRRIMQAHGGDLVVESGFGKGTTFSLTLQEVSS